MMPRLKAGGVSGGAPGLRPQYHSTYYAAFIIDPDGNRDRGGDLSQG